MKQLEYQTENVCDQRTNRMLEQGLGICSKFTDKILANF